MLRSLKLCLHKVHIVAATVADDVKSVIDAVEL